MLARAFAVRESEDDKQREWGNQSTTWTRLILRRRSTDRSNVGAAPIRECLTRIGARNPSQSVSTFLPWRRLAACCDGQAFVHAPSSQLHRQDQNRSNAIPRHCDSSPRQ